MAYPASKPGMLNKITGCESRTVPPLYMLRSLFGESQSLGMTLGRRGDARVAPDPQGMSQKTYEVSSPTVCVFMDGVLVAEKRLRHSKKECRSLFVFRRKTI